MKEQTELETGKVLEAAKEKLIKSLEETWKSLWWEPKLKNSEGREIEAFQVQSISSKNKSIIVIRHGRMFKVKGKDLEEAEELSAIEYANFAPKAEIELEKLKKEQWKEIKNTSEGKDCLWWPDQFRFGTWYCSYSDYSDFGRYTEPITVRVKKDGLYCPNHPDKALTHARAPGQGESFHYTICPEEKCSFSVYNGT